MKSLILICAVGMAFGQTKEPECQAYYPQYCSAGKCEPLQCEFPTSPLIEPNVIGTALTVDAYPFVTNRWEPWLVDDFKAGTIIYVAPWPTLPIPKELRHAP